MKVYILDQKKFFLGKNIHLLEGKSAKMHGCYSKHRTIRVINITEIKRMASYTLFFPLLPVFNKIHHLSSKSIYFFSQSYFHFE